MILDTDFNLNDTMNRISLNLRVTTTVLLGFDRTEAGEDDTDLCAMLLTEICLGFLPIVGMTALTAVHLLLPLWISGAFRVLVVEI